MTGALSWGARLVDELRKGDMLRGDIANLLGVTPPTVRKYVNKLGNLVEARFDPLAEETSYRLTGEVARVDAFLLSLDRTKPRAAPLSHLQKAMACPSRHFHIMQDDEAYPVRVSRAEPVRDPMVSALFGAPGAQP